MGRKVPLLRKGLTVAELREGCWVDSPTRYEADYSLRCVDEIVDLALQRLIDCANNGDRVHSKAVAGTLHNVASYVTALSSSINERLKAGELTPTILDEITG